MHILFITTAHNSLSQRLFVELTRRGHTVLLCVGASSHGMCEAVRRARPDLIIAPMLKTAIPEQVWRNYRCLIVHPGIPGDRGPSSLDWAISLGANRWGVTILQADAEMDAGPIWASETFPMPREPVTKSSLYRADVTEAAVRGVLEALALVEGRTRPPRRPDDDRRPKVEGQLRPAMRQRDRAIDWRGHTAQEIARRIRAADSHPGVLTTLLGQDVYVYGAVEEERMSGPPGQVLGRRHGAICVGTVDGGLWISHAKVKSDVPGDAGIKLPAAVALGHRLRSVPHSEFPIDAAPPYRTYREIQYWEQDSVGYLAFDFYNGAMSTAQCGRLTRAFTHAASRPTHVICLLGGRDFWSNGIHLNMIEAAADPATESWRNINAMDDLVLQVLTARQFVVAGLRGNAGAGGVMLALAADHVYARSGVVLNPHYRTMGNLYGSEYWTYTLPRRVGAELAHELTTACQPMGVQAACETGLIDAAFGTTAEDFQAELVERAHGLASDPHLRHRLANKQKQRRADERARPLASYRAYELLRMADNFFGRGADQYHQARQQFVRKRPAASWIGASGWPWGIGPEHAAG
jgi:putative two-component system hydrogenase maturation factor HypX/HoxX